MIKLNLNEKPKIISYDLFKNELQKSICVMTNNININFVNEIIHFIENYEHEDINDIYFNKKKNDIIKNKKDDSSEELENYIDEYDSDSNNTKNLVEYNDDNNNLNKYEDIQNIKNDSSDNDENEFNSSDDIDIDDDRKEYIENGESIENKKYYNYENMTYLINANNN